MSIIGDMYEEQVETLLKENAELKDRVRELEDQLESANREIHHLEQDRY
jgi:peptidoglycan hydrolase CwlO-like protein